MTHTKTSAPVNYRPTQFIVMSRAAKMPSSCWGRYRRVGLVEVQPELFPAGRSEPNMLSDRARGVVRVLTTRESLHHGGARSASARACDELGAVREALVAKRMADQHAPKMSADRNSA
jgi:hypothetical protein